VTSEMHSPVYAAVASLQGVQKVWTAPGDIIRMGDTNVTKESL